jgi:hypothetical protein
MIVVKLLVFIIIWMIFPPLFSGIKNNFMKTIQFLFQKIKFTFQRMYRLLNVKNASHFVWIDLIKYHKSSGWNFGQFYNEKYIECGFKVDDINFVEFNYSVTPEKLTFRATILQGFDEEITNDILVLASHFNGLLPFGVVKVSIKYNYVEFVYSRDLLIYSLFPGEIGTDTENHFKFTKDCFWSFRSLIETGDDPVFVFSEFLRRNEEKKNKND